MVFQVDQFILSISLTLKYMYFTYIKYQYRAKNNFLSSGEKNTPTSLGGVKVIYKCTFSCAQSTSRPMGDDWL